MSNGANEPPLYVRVRECPHVFFPVLSRSNAVPSSNNGFSDIFIIVGRTRSDDGRGRERGHGQAESEAVGGHGGGDGGDGIAFPQVRRRTNERSPSWPTWEWSNAHERRMEGRSVIFLTFPVPALTLLWTKVSDNG